MTNNKMKYFTRLDGGGRRIPGSGVLRLSKPKTGSWVEDVANTCCGPSITIVSTPADVYLRDIILSILCDDVEVLAITSTGVSTTIGEMVDALNANYSYLGTFSTDGTDITLLLTLSIANTLCDGTLSMTVTGETTSTTTSTTLP